MEKALPAVRPLTSVGSLCCRVSGEGTKTQSRALSFCNTTDTGPVQTQQDTERRQAASPPTPPQSNQALADKLHSYEYNAHVLVPGHALPI